MVLDLQSLPGVPHPVTHSAMPVGVISGACEGRWEEAAEAEQLGSAGTDAGTAVADKPAEAIL